jgi:peptide/nickel transport system permease protein
MGEDHVLAARAQGLSGRRVRWSVLRSAILPGACGVPLAIGLVVTIQLLVEVVFSYPGIGYLLFRAVINHDYPLLRGVIVVIVVVALAANLLADVMGAFIDPRSRQEAWPEVRAPGRATRPHPA